MDPTSTPALSDNLHQHLRQAYDAQARGDLDLALRECQSAIKLDHDCAEAHNLHGVLLQRVGKTQPALIAFQEAARLDPNLQNVRDNLLELQVALRSGKAPVTPQERVGKVFHLRAAAYINDFVIMNIIALGVGATVSVLQYMVNPGKLARIASASGSSGPFTDLIPGLLLNLFYFVLFEWLYGATPAKFIMRMRVVQEDGTRCQLPAALARGILRFVEGLFLGVPAAISMKPPLHQRYGDKLARTMVVSSSSPMIQQPREFGWFLAALAIYFGTSVLLVFLT